MLSYAKPTNQQVKESRVSNNMDTEVTIMKIHLLQKRKHLTFIINLLNFHLYRNDVKAYLFFLSD